jgi:hypothetical protein
VTGWYERNYSNGEDFRGNFGGFYCRDSGLLERIRIDTTPFLGRLNPGFKKPGLKWHCSFYMGNGSRVFLLWKELRGDFVGQGNH